MSITLSTSTDDSEIPVSNVFPFVKRVMINITPTIHASMRQLAKRRRAQIGLLYEEAILVYLERPENYLGENHKL